MKIRRLLVAAAATGSLLLPPLTAGIAGTATAQTAEATVSTDIQPAEFVDQSWRDIISQKNAEKNTDRIQEVTVHSPSMDRDIPVVLIKAQEENRPTIYLLNGAGGGEQKANWIQQTDMLDFYLDKDVNVVLPMRGAFSYYTDWNNPPSTNYMQGPQKWDTFLTKELPSPIENYLNANDQRGIIGMSMSATSSLVLPAKNPDLYDAAGSFSGCAETNSPLGRASIGITINNQSSNGGRINPDAIWGPSGTSNAGWNDALIQAENLRNTNLYVSNASGLTGQRETTKGLLEQGIPQDALSANKANLTILGGGIEAVTNACTHRFVAKLNKLNIDVHHAQPAVGTHTWSYWQDALHDSWYKTFAPTFGM